MSRRHHQDNQNALRRDHTASRFFKSNNYMAACRPSLKKLALSSMTAALCACIWCAPALAQDSTTVIINGTPLTQTALIGSTGSDYAVKATPLLQAMGATVKVEGLKLEAVMGSDKIELKVGQNICRVNGSELHLSTPFGRSDGDLVVPLREFCQALGASVSTNGDNYAVYRDNNGMAAAAVTGIPSYDSTVTTNTYTANSTYNTEAQVQAPMPVPTNPTNMPNGQNMPPGLALMQSSLGTGSLGTGSLVSVPGPNNSTFSPFPTAGMGGLTNNPDSLTGPYTRSQVSATMIGDRSYTTECPRSPEEVMQSMGQYGGMGNMSGMSGMTGMSDMSGMSGMSSMPNMSMSPTMGAKSGLASMPSSMSGGMPSGMSGAMSPNMNMNATTGIPGYGGANMGTYGAMTPQSTPYGSTYGTPQVTGADQYQRPQDLQFAEGRQQAATLINGPGNYSSPYGALNNGSTDAVDGGYRVVNEGDTGALSMAQSVQADPSSAQQDSQLTPAKTEISFFDVQRIMTFHFTTYQVTARIKNSGQLAQSKPILVKLLARKKGDSSFELLESYVVNPLPPGAEVEVKKTVDGHQFPCLINLNVYFKVAVIEEDTPQLSQSEQHKSAYSEKYKAKHGGDSWDAQALNATRTHETASQEKEMSF